MKKSTHFDPPHLESPPPKIDLVDDVDEETFTNQIKKIQSGRLSIVCIQAANLRRKDKNKSQCLLSYSIRFVLGINSKTILVKSSKTQQSTSQSPSFEKEIVQFDIHNPSDMVCDNEKDIKLKIEVLDQSPLQSFVMGEMTISAMRFLHGPPTEEWIPLLQNNDKSSNSSIFLKFMYTPVRNGMLSLTLIDSKNLLLYKTNTIPSSTRLGFSIGEKMTHSSESHDKHGHPTYSFEKNYLHLNKENWFDVLLVQIFNVTPTNQICFGQNSVNILPLMSNHVPNVNKMSLLLNDIETDNVVVGELSFQAEFLYSSILNIKIVGTKSLKDIEGSQGKMSPYIVCKSKGRSSYPEYRTKTLCGEGDLQKWEEEFSFSVVDHSTLTIECYNDDFLTDTHELIGSGDLSLLPVYRTGQLSTWVNLTRSNEVGAMLPCGQVNVTLTFEDAGSTFPLLHESNTKMALKKGISRSVNNPSHPLGQKVVQDMRKNDDHGEEFSDEDIRSTFNFLDLDKNGYVGANELRHILINMGELITDEEVDTMISMLDGQGDGQVNFQQFSTMARTPNELEGSSLGHKGRADNVKTTHAISTGNIGLEAKTRKILDFVNNNRIKKRDVSVARDFFLRKHRAFISHKEQDITSDNYESVWELDYETFCSILPIQDTGESQQVFYLFDNNGSGKIDLRLLILSLSNFTSSYTTEERCSLMFALFDDQTGYIKPNDLEIILAGTHLKSQRDVSRKAQTVLKFVDNKGSNKISRKSLLQAAIKFPNLLLPKYSS